MRIVGLQNLFRRHALFRETVRTDLAHPNAVTPTAAHESEVSDAARFVVFAIDDEELFTQTERGTDAASTHMSGAVGAYDLEVGYAMGRSARDDAQVDDWSNASCRTRQTSLHLTNAHSLGPIRKRRETIGGGSVRCGSNFQVINLPIKSDVISNRFATHQDQGRNCVSALANMTKEKCIVVNFERLVLTFCGTENHLAHARQAGAGLLKLQ